MRLACAPGSAGHYSRGRAIVAADQALGELYRNLTRPLGRERVDKSDIEHHVLRFEHKYRPDNLDTALERLREAYLDYWNALRGDQEALDEQQFIEANRKPAAGPPHHRSRLDRQVEDRGVPGGAGLLHRVRPGGRPEGAGGAGGGRGDRQAHGGSAVRPLHRGPAAERGLGGQGTGHRRGRLSRGRQGAPRGGGNLQIGPVLLRGGADHRPGRHHRHVREEPRRGGFTSPKYVWASPARRSRDVGFMSVTAAGRPRTRPDAVLADRAIRSRLRQRGIRAVIPQPSEQIGHRLRRGSAGGRPPSFGAEAYKQRNAVERCVNRPAARPGDANGQARHRLSGRTPPRRDPHPGPAIDGRRRSRTQRASAGEEPVPTCSTTLNARRMGTVSSAGRHAANPS